MNAKPAVHKNMFKFGILVVSTGVLTTVGLIAWDTWGADTSAFADRGTPTPVVTATALPVITLHVPLLMVVRDGQIVFYDQPEGMPKPYHAPAETLLTVIVREERRLNGTEWFYLELTEIEGQGWVKADEMLDIHVGPTRSFDTFQFCLGSDASPTGPCGSSLPMPGNEVWLSYRFKGLERGAVLQTVVVVEGEQYQSAPQTWNGSMDGTQLIRLISTHKLPATVGLWTVKFYVDGEFVTESSVQIRP